MSMIWKMTYKKTKTRHSTSATTTGELDEPREYAAKLGETSTYTTRPGRRLIKASRYGE